jgi:hypothetical protein
VTAWVTALRTGLAGLTVCVGAWIVTLGSELIAVVSDLAMPLKPHKSSIERIATAGLAMQSDENFM